MSVSVDVSVARINAGPIVHGGQWIVVGRAGERAAHHLVGVTEAVLVVVAAAVFRAAYAGVHIVANAVVVGIRRAPATADAEDVKLVSVAVAVAFGEVGAPACVDVAGTVADATGVEFAHAVVDVITDAIGIGIRGAVAATDAQGVKLVTLNQGEKLQAVARVMPDDESDAEPEEIESKAAEDPGTDS